jgi:hypothetical protein
MGSLAILAVVLVAAPGCASASYDEKFDYLRTAAKRGADAHQLIVSQGGRPDQKRCAAVLKG